MVSEISLCWGSLNGEPGGLGGGRAWKKEHLYPGVFISALGFLPLRLLMERDFI